MPNRWVSTTKRFFAGDDFIAVITSMASRISGRRTSKRRVERIQRCVLEVMKEEDEQEHESGTGLQN